MSKMREAFEAWWFLRTGGSRETNSKENAWAGYQAAIAAVKEGGVKAYIYTRRREGN